MKKFRNLIIFAAAITIVLGISAFTVIRENLKRPPAEKEYSLEIVHKDGTIKEVELKTKARTLGEALKEAPLVKVAFTRWGTVILEADGQKFNDEGDGGVWQVIIDEEPVIKNADRIPLEQDGYYTLIYSTYLSETKKQDTALD